MSASLDIAPYDLGAALELERELGVPHVVAQVLARRGWTEPGPARTFLAAEERHPVSAFAGIDVAVETILGHVRAGTQITVHGDYDVDGVCSTTILVRALRALGGTVDWVLPSRMDDGYGLSPATVERLAARGTRLLVTVDCAITAVEEVAAARAAGLDVVVTDHHSPRADGALPDAPIVHPAVCGYPCPDLCAAGVAAKLVEALGGDPAADAELVALATVCDVVPLTGENRRLVREGLRALRATRSPGLRALMRVAQVEPGTIDASALGFRLGPRINAAGRLRRADAGVELLLTDDAERAGEIATELDSANVERRAVEQRIGWEAERQVAELGERPAYVLWADDWHPGVVGIVASRVAERHLRPAVLLAPDPKDAASWTGSGRSIPGFDLLSSLQACADVIGRHGGHRAAAGLALPAANREAFRAAFEAVVADGLTDDLLVRRERVDAVVGGAELGLETAEAMAALGPFGMGNPEPVLLVPGARCRDRRPMGEDKHLRLSVEAGGVRARAVAFGAGSAGARRDMLEVDGDASCDVTVRLEAREWNGAVEPRLIMRGARACAPAPVEVVGEPTPEAWLRAALGLDVIDGPAPAQPTPLGAGPAAALGGGQRTVVDRRGGGTVAVLADLVASGEPVLAVVADVARRRPGLAERTGGYALCSWAALEADPALAAPYRHVVVLDPPAVRPPVLPGPGWTLLAWGPDELRFSVRMHEHEHDLRPSLAELFRSLRGQAAASGDELAAILRGDAERPRSAAHAGRLVRVLSELDLVRVDADPPALTVVSEERTALERSPTYVAATERLEDGRRFLSDATVPLAA